METKNDMPKIYITYGLVAVNIILYILCIPFGNYFHAEWVFDPILILNESAWHQVVTSMFLHADMDHLASNMILLYAVGDMIEEKLGHVKYFFLYMLSGILANIATLAVDVLTMDFTRSLGASGAVFGIIGALLWMVIRNRKEEELITVPKMLLVIAISLYNGFIGTDINNAAHVGGLIAGFLLAVIVYRKKGKAEERGRMQ